MGRYKPLNKHCGEVVPESSFKMPCLPPPPPIFQNEPDPKTALCPTHPVAFKMNLILKLHTPSPTPLAFKINLILKLHTPSTTPWLSK